MHTLFCGGLSVETLDFSGVDEVDAESWCKVRRASE